MIMMQKKDAEGKKIFRDETEKLIKSTEAILVKQNKKFLFADKLTAADFSKAGYIFAHWRNPNHAFGTEFTSIA